MNREEKLQMGILIAIFIFIAVLIVAIIVLVKNIDVIKNNPIDYGIDKSQLMSCTCFTQEGQRFYFGETNDPFALIDT